MEPWPDTEMPVLDGDSSIEEIAEAADFAATVAGMVERSLMSALTMPLSEVTDAIVRAMDATLDKKTDELPNGYDYTVTFKIESVLNVFAAQWTRFADFTLAKFNERRTAEQVADGG